MNVKRKFAITVLMGTGLGMVGCQAPMTNGLSFWGKGGKSSLNAATPDVGKQRYELLSKEFGSQAVKPGASAPLGSTPPPADDNFLLASWKKTTAAVGGALGSKPKESDSPTDPLRLDTPTKKMGPEVHVAVARLMENQAKFTEAQTEYEKALKLAPNDIPANVGLARLHDRQGRGREALSLYQRALKAEPSNALVYNDLGLCYARQKELELAAGALEKAVQLQPTNVKYRNNLAAVLVESGREDDALRQLASATSPAVAHYNLGCLLLQKGQSAEALRYCQKALAIDPGLTPAREMMARIGGNFDASPMAAQPSAASQPLMVHSQPTTAAPGADAPSRAPQSAQPAAEPQMPYAAGATGQEIYTSSPQLPTAAAAGPSPSFHVGDDGPAAQTASRPNWNEWSAGGASSLSRMQPLPPVE